MPSKKSVIFDARFLSWKKQSGIARDSKAFCEQFSKNEWSINLLNYKERSSEGGDVKTLPLIPIDKSLTRVTLESVLFRKQLKFPDLESSYFYLSQVSPIKVETKSSACQRIIRIHDLFPITHPEWFTPKARLNFKVGLESIDTKDILIANSKTTRKSILEYLNGRITTSQVRQIFCPITELETTIACGICVNCVKPNSELNYFLSVGTIEPRKNYISLLTSWKKSEPNSLGFKLIIVGNSGWNNKRIISQISSQKNVIHVSGICDYQLSELYKNAFAFVSASLDEGFNIPLQESRQLGSRLILSDIKIHHEFVEKNEAVWFDPLSQSSTTDALNKSLNISSKHPRRYPDYSFERQLKHFLEELSS
jgi:glycosyltransferase involved in cell wall biosynthesis